MNLDDVVSKVTDPYDRQARLYPALLCLFPLLAFVALLYAPSTSALAGVVSVAISCGGLFLLINICREMGKRLEEKLFTEWGGAPTTQLLRHRDGVIDSVTKKRYHAFLATKIGCIFPDAEQERLQPDRADEVYRSGVQWLLDHTRLSMGKQFDLLFRDNITYGFRRNALGIKPLAIVVALGCLLWALVKEHVIFGATAKSVDLGALTQMSPQSMASVAVSAVMLLVWLFFFTRTSLRTSASTFAKTLLRTCDTF